MKCIFCGETTLLKTITFTLKTLQKCITILEYRRSKPVLRKSRNPYNNLELSIESINEVYHAHCYKLFTALKIPQDFQYLQQQQSVLKRDNASEVSAKSCESHAPLFEECSTSHAAADSESVEAAGTSTDEMGATINIDEDNEDFKKSFIKAMPVAPKDSASQTCFICDKQRKRNHGCEIRLSNATLKTIDNFKKAATEQNDIPMLEKLNLFSDDSNISYHKFCKDQYLREIFRDGNTDFLRKRKVFITAYTILCDMLEERVVQNNECLFFDNIKKQYQQLLEQQGSLLYNSIAFSSFSDRHLERKIMETFYKKIQIIYAEKKKVLVPFAPKVFKDN